MTNPQDQEFSLPPEEEKISGEEEARPEGETGVGEPVAPVGETPGEGEAPYGDGVPDDADTQPVELPKQPEAPVIKEHDCGEITALFINGQKGLLNAEAEAIVAGMERFLEGDGATRMAFDECRLEEADRIIFVSPERMRELSLWFIGDLHGDFLALEAALRTIKEETPADRTPHLVFLGDLIDDGPDSYEVVLRVFRLIQEGWAVSLLVGNHCEGLACGNDLFTSAVSPAEFSEWLNSHGDDPVKRRLGEAYIRLVARLPRAIFFADGLLAAHGGIPHSDLWESIRTRADLNRPECLRDFVWTRAHERARRKIPNRHSSGCQFGTEDFDHFCDLMGERLELPVRMMIRGHCHLEDRYAFYAKYIRHPLLTINTMCHRLAREIYGPYARRPCIARWVEHGLPEVYRLELREEVIREVYPEPEPDA